MTRVRRPQSNGILESFHRTLLDEHFRVEGHRTWIVTIVEMQAVVNDYPEGYNSLRPHQGYGLNGGTPIRAFTEGLPKTTTKEVTEPAKPPNSKPPDDPAKRGIVGEYRLCTFSAITLAATVIFRRGQ